MNSTGRLDELVRIFDDARQSAARCAFDLPSIQAIKRTEKLLRLAASSVDSIATFDIAIGEDGSIELTAAPGGRLITLDISPSGAKVEMVVRDTVTGELLASEQAATNTGIVRWIER
jgi:hypothetical protein